jgi:hypothetical protein
VFLASQRWLPEEQLRTALSPIQSDEAIDNQAAVRLKETLARDRPPPHTDSVSTSSLSVRS